jgi:DNA-binding response OmpR family regulator
VIEHNDLFAGLLREIPEQQGSPSLRAVDTAPKCATRRPALVDTDMLPKLDGLAVIKQLRAMHDCPSFLAITGGGRMNAAITLGLAFQLGACRVLRKPFPAATNLPDASCELPAPG